jgi:hypothetical protein
VSSDPVNPRFARFTDRIASAIPWFSLAFGAALIGAAIWGFWFCWAVAHEDFIPPATSGIVLVLGWMVFFLPIALLGAGVSRAAIRHLRKAGHLRGSEAKVQIMPPQAPSVLNRPAQEVRTEPLDEATTRRLDQVADRAARIFSVSTGVLLLAGGLAGFVMGWIFTYRPAIGHSASASSWQYQIGSFRLLTRFLVACGLAVLAGLVILRETFRKPSNDWLLPLKVFTGIVSRRAREEAAQRQKRLPKS